MSLQPDEHEPEPLLPSVWEREKNTIVALKRSMESLAAEGTELDADEKISLGVVSSPGFTQPQQEHAGGDAGPAMVTTVRMTTLEEERQRRRNMNAGGGSARSSRKSTPRRKSPWKARASADQFKIRQLEYQREALVDQQRRAKRGARGENTSTTSGAPSRSASKAHVAPTTEAVVAPPWLQSGAVTVGQPITAPLMSRDESAYALDVPLAADGTPQPALSPVMASPPIVSDQSTPAQRHSRPKTPQPTPTAATSIPQPAFQFTPRMAVTPLRNPQPNDPTSDALKQRQGEAAADGKTPTGAVVEAAGDGSVGPKYAYRPSLLDLPMSPYREALQRHEGERPEGRSAVDRLQITSVMGRRAALIVHEFGPSSRAALAFVARQPLKTPVPFHVP